MEFFDVLKNRRSTRKFTSEQVPEELVEKLLAAANAAPVGSNLYKDLHLTVVRDRAALDLLAQAMGRRREDRADMEKITAEVRDSRARGGGPDPFYGAGTVIFVSHRRQTLQPGIEYCNAASLVETMHLAATALGLCSVFMWGSLEAMRMYPEYDHTDVLKLPEGFEPLLGLAVGYGEEKPPRELTTEKIGVNFIP